MVSGRVDDVEESGGEDPITAPITARVISLKVNAEVMARVLWVVGEKGRSKLFNRFWTLIPWSRLRRGKLKKVWLLYLPD